jgi:hypothetical protein
MLFYSKTFPEEGEWRSWLSFLALSLMMWGFVEAFFWADGRACTTYMQFLDVVVFDVTYKTNEFKLPFAPFTGVKHHVQSTLFGCSLLADEMQETFVWLFENLLKCKHNIAPKTIITYQDPAICNAMKTVFLETHHRYCTWHISIHEGVHLHSLKCAHNKFAIDYYKWSKGCKTVEVAEIGWMELTEKNKPFFDEPLNEM